MSKLTKAEQSRTYQQGFYTDTVEGREERGRGRERERDRERERERGWEDKLGGELN